MSRYRVDLYEDAEGRSRIKEFLQWAKREAPRVHKVALYLMNDYLPAVAPDGFSFPKSKHISGAIYELRGKAPQGAVRIYYFRLEEYRYVATAGEVKNGRDEADPNLVDYSLAAYADFTEEEK